VITPLLLSTSCSVKPISQYCDSTTRLRRKIDVNFLLASNRVEWKQARAIRRSRIVVVSQSNRSCNHGIRYVRCTLNRQVLMMFAFAYRLTCLLLFELCHYLRCFLRFLASISCNYSMSANFPRKQMQY